MNPRFIALVSAVVVALAAGAFFLIGRGGGDASTGRINSFSFGDPAN